MKAAITHVQTGLEKTGLKPSPIPNLSRTALLRATKRSISHAHLYFLCSPSISFCHWHARIDCAAWRDKPEADGGIANIEERSRQVRAYSERCPVARRQGLLS